MSKKVNEKNREQTIEAENLNSGLDLNSYG